MNLTIDRLEHIVATLRMYYGLEDAEIVGLLGCPEHIYKSMLKRATEKMSKKMFHREKIFAT